MGRIRRTRDEDGFTLIELLVVVIIIGILAVIAVPVYMQQRRKAWMVAAEGDLRNAAIQAEDYYEVNGTYVGLDTVPLRTSRDNVLVVSDMSPVSYCLVADHQKLAGAADYHFSLDLGRPVPGPC